jgi:hypothetical protein
VRHRCQLRRTTHLRLLLVVIIVSHSLALAHTLLSRYRHILHLRCCRLLLLRCRLNRGLCTDA